MVLGGDDVDAPVLLVELNFAVSQRKKGKVVSTSYVASRMIFGSSLTKYYVSGQNLFTTEFFHPEALAVAVSSVFGCALSFLVSHD